jgi:hypothetical protein
MMLRPLILSAVLLVGMAPAQAALIDNGPIPDIGRYLQGCWVSDEGTLTEQIAANDAAHVELCFTDGALDTTLIDAAGERHAGAPGSYIFRDTKIILTGTSDPAWVFGRPTVICDVGVKAYYHLGLLDCVGSGQGQTTVFFDDLLFVFPPRAAS